MKQMCETVTEVTIGTMEECSAYITIVTRQSLACSRFSADAKPAFLCRHNGAFVGCQSRFSPSRQSYKRQTEKKIDCRGHYPDSDVIVIRRGKLTVDLCQFDHRDNRN